MHIERCGFTAEPFDEVLLTCDLDARHKGPHCRRGEDVEDDCWFDDWGSSVDAH